MRLGIRLREPTRSNRPVRVAQVCGTTDVMILLLVASVTLVAWRVSALLSGKAPVLTVVVVACLVFGGAALAGRPSLPILG